MRRIACSWIRRRAQFLPGVREYLRDANMSRFDIAASEEEKLSQVLLVAKIPGTPGRMRRHS
jgi:hypothetical protein